MKIIEEKENSLLDRKEVRIVVEAKKNPAMQEALKIVADKFKADEELTAVKGIKGKFGRNTFLISAYIYRNKEAKEQLEKTKGRKAAPKTSAAAVKS